MPRTELYIGNLGRDVSRKDIESVFDKYGRLLRCDIKNKGYGSIYAFLEFEEERDAEDALNSENGKDMCGSSMLIEWAKSRKDRGNFNSDNRSGRNGFGRGERSLECYECGRRGHFARDCRERRDSDRRRSDRDRGDRYDRDRTSNRERRRHSRSRSRSRSRSISRRRSRSRS